MAPAPSLMPVRRASAALAWALLLLVASLGSLSQGSLLDGSFTTAAGGDDAAAVSQRVVANFRAEQALASSDGLLPAITASDVRILGNGNATAPAAARAVAGSSQRHFSAQPRAPPAI